jgi:hypothetical protein
LVGGLDRTSDAGCKAAGEELVQLLLATAREEEPEKRPPQSELLVRLALERYRLGVTDADEPFAVACEGPNIALMFRGSREALRSTLAREFRRKYGSTPNASALADAITVLQGEALECAHEPVHLRVAEHEDGIVIDLGDPSGAVVFVRPGGWAVQAVSPVVFRRTALSGALPVPERGGSLEELRPLVNTTDATWSLLLGWIVAACTPSVPHPVLLLGGEQGAGKTTTAVFSLGLFDPSPAPVRSPPRDPEAWAISCAGSWGVAVDNISFIPDWFSDALCKAVTGDGWMRRKLYTDGEIAVLSFRRVIALTSIDVGALRGDLADRLLIVDLLPIDRRNRRSKRQLDRLYERARPRILGAVLDLLAAVLNALPSIDLAEMPRMADFAQVLAAMDRVLGTASLAEYESQATRIAEEVVDDDPVGAAIVAFAHKVGSWGGTTEELGNRIKPETPPKDWPKTPRALSSRFRRLITVLRASGIELRPPSRTDKTRTWCLQLLGEQPPPTASTAQSPANGRPDTGRGDSDRAVGTAQTGDRPSNRPTDGPSAVAEERDTGRSGGSGGQNRSPSVAPGPPHPCFGCGRLKWFSLAGLQHWTCGSCHDPSAHMGDVIWWHGNEVRE